MSRHWIHLEFAGQHTVVPGPVDHIRYLVRNWNRHQFSRHGFPHRLLQAVETDV